MLIWFESCAIVQMGSSRLYNSFMPAGSRSVSPTAFMAARISSAPLWGLAEGRGENLELRRRFKLDWRKREKWNCQSDGHCCRMLGLARPVDGTTLFDLLRSPNRARRAANHVAKPNWARRRLSVRHHVTAASAFSLTELLTEVPRNHLPALPYCCLLH